MHALERFCFKFFADSHEGVEPESYIPVFHAWIRAGRTGTLLIDVADYRHVPDGPLVLLVGHEADYAIDQSEGPLGLLYNHKRLASGTNPERFLAGLRETLAACRQLEQESALAGLGFSGQRLRFIANDRLIARNDDRSLAELQPELLSVLERLYPGEALRIERDTTDSRGRLTVDVTAAAPVDVQTLLDRLAG